MSIRRFLDKNPDVVRFGKGILKVIGERKVSLKGKPEDIVKRAYITNGAESRVQSSRFSRNGTERMQRSLPRSLKRKENRMPYNRHRRIHLEEKEGRWYFNLHLGDGQSHQDSKGYYSAEEAVREAMVFSSLITLTVDSADRRRRWLEGAKTHGIVETQPTDD
jgi:hypothetical protein